MFKNQKTVGAFLAVILLVIAFLPSCSAPPESQTAQPSKLKIVTSIFPYYDFARRIAGEKADVINIVPPGVEPHEYEPGTGDIKTIYSANIFVYNGLGVDSWAERLHPDLEKKGIRVINVNRIIPSSSIITLADNREASDPHIWMDFNNAGLALKAVAEAIEAGDPQNRSFYETNYQNYNKELQNLSARFGSELTDCSVKDFISTHLAFEYLAKASGLTNHAISGISTEQEPSPKRIAEIIQLVREKNLKYIYVDSLESSKFADVIAAETGAQIQQLYTLENVTKDQIKDSSITYVSLMKHNLENLKKGLACQANPSPLVTQ